MKGKLNNDYAIIKIPLMTPYHDLTFRESSMLGLLLSDFNTSNHKPKGNITWNKKTLGVIFKYGHNVLDRILKSLRDKEYMNYSSQNNATVFTLMPKGLEIYNAMYKNILN